MKGMELVMKNNPRTYCDYVYSVDGKIRCKCKTTHYVKLDSKHKVYLCKSHAEDTNLGKAIKIKSN